MSAKRNLIRLRFQDPARALRNPSEPPRKKPDAREAQKPLTTQFRSTLSNNNGPQRPKAQTSGFLSSRDERRRPHLRRAREIQFLPETPFPYCSRQTVPRTVCRASNGGGGRNRTDDLMLAKHALSQLSYAPFAKATKGAARKLVGQGRLELPTSRLSSARSNQLSYWPDLDVRRQQSGIRSLAIHRSLIPGLSEKRCAGGGHAIGHGFPVLRQAPEGQSLRMLP